MASKHSFISAKESSWFISVFDLYCRLLFRRRFSKIHLNNEYSGYAENKTIYYLNHSSWWDGLIPFYLNQKIFRQNARGMMEDKQLNRYKFFRRLGVFSINLSDARSSLRSLRYAVESMGRENSALYIYPQGEIVPFTAEEIRFKKGLGWIAKQCPNADLVPIAIYIHTMKSDKPELVIRIGKPVETDREQDADDLNRELESSLLKLMRETVGG